ncbi:hypothetical protein Ccar_15125 [Clostridium carboxidivorans P7]|uniref:Uncharacterized protein n=1 Tax=Clostridium carboxidivorans P7 TaxID=536227 RepID=C6Q213_9CLOT|nr:hypothetical protein [Clostridium carboxidivorans]AKN32123.1 hypothetical protein Ccar_15125 [Clostridium carboxidivorans P7]EET84474.1 conserved hypothetical protein [Clostridium carboxidivorans P7]
MDKFKLEDIKDVHVGHIPAAKKGIVDSLMGKDLLKESVSLEHMSSYKQGHQLGTEIENLLKGYEQD